MSWAAHLDDWIVLYTLDGWTLLQIADRYGCAMETVRQVLREAGVEMRAKGERFSAPERQRDLAQAYTSEREFDLPQANEQHVAAVLAALRGLRFPTMPQRSAA